jgi:hypothetical protein
VGLSTCAEKPSARKGLTLDTKIASLQRTPITNASRNKRRSGQNPDLLIFPSFCLLSKFVNSRFLPKIFVKFRKAKFSSRRSFFAFLSLFLLVPLCLGGLLCVLRGFDFDCGRWPRRSLR